MLKIGVLASHEGTTLQCILDACTARRIQGDVVVVISNNGNSGALSRAKAAGVPAHHLSSVTHPAQDSLDVAISAVLSAREVDIVFLAGYLKRLGPVTLTAFRGRVLNTHPALLPKFGGHGMFGDHVFEAVLASGQSESGVSVHLVDDDYDTGRVVRQARVPVKSTDSLESLKARTRDCEREVVVQTLAAIATGELQLAGPAKDQPDRQITLASNMFDRQPTLVGELVELRPLRQDDWGALFAVASDPLIWEQHPASDRYREDVFRRFFTDALNSGGALAAIDRATGHVIGSSRYHAFDPAKRDIEIGWTFLGRRYWGGKYNGEMKRLMLEHAFKVV